MEKTGKHQNKYWAEYYKNNNANKLASPFCKFICDNLDLKNKKILELCSGDGRDTYNLAKHCKHITAVDYATKPENSTNAFFNQARIEDFLQDLDSKSYDFVYCRFGLHSVTEKVEDLILDFCNKIVFEFRSDKDDSFEKDHYRRTINGNRFIEKLINKNYEISYFIESNKLAVFASQDPMIIRVIASKKEL